MNSPKVAFFQNIGKLNGTSKNPTLGKCRSSIFKTSPKSEIFINFIKAKNHKNVENSLKSSIFYDFL